LLTLTLLDAHGDPRRYLAATSPRRYVTQEADRQVPQQGQTSAALDSHSRSHDVDIFAPSSLLTLTPEAGPTNDVTQEADRQVPQQGQTSAALDSHSRSDVHVDLENFPCETVIPCRAAAPDSSVVVISSDDEDP
jgi:hypothetical protein